MLISGIAYFILLRGRETHEMHNNSVIPDMKKILPCRVQRVHTKMRIFVDQI